MPITTVSTKGQVTLPARMRKKLGIRPHDRVVIESTDDAIVIRRTGSFLELEGFLGRALPESVERKKMIEEAARRGLGGES